MSSALTWTRVACVARPLLCVTLLLGLLGACSECGDGLCDDEADIYAYSSPAPPSCSSLSHSACERSSHCILDSVCASSSACSSTRCSETCDLVQVCVPY